MIRAVTEAIQSRTIFVAGARDDLLRPTYEAMKLDESVELRVLDSTADLRYLVLPRRPAGRESMSEEELAGLVTRDSMIGVAEPLAPVAASV